MTKWRIMIFIVAVVSTGITVLADALWTGNECGPFIQDTRVQVRCAAPRLPWIRIWAAQEALPSTLAAKWNWESQRAFAKRGGSAGVLDGEEMLEREAQLSRIRAQGFDPVALTCLVGQRSPAVVARKYFKVARLVVGLGFGGLAFSCELSSWFVSEAGYVSGPFHPS